MPEILSITQFMRHLRRHIESDPTLQDAWIEGEISNLTKARSGHWYFSLKDADATVKCVMWRSDAARQSVDPREGDRIAAHGRVGVYEPRGDVQFYADFLRAAGVGDLYAEFERLRNLLTEEGLFDPAAKKPLPTMPRRIGIVTSADAAAYQDVLNVLRRRYPLADVTLSPSLVQGSAAPARLIAALQQLDTTVDVILIVRGGGSIEDLWAFNDEALTRAIFAAHTPIITGVGHETDFTLVDFVADLRAPTPSAAAEVATPNLVDLRADVLDARTRLADAFTDQITRRRGVLQNANRSLTYLSPAGEVRNQRQRVDELRNTLRSATQSRLQLLQERLAARSAALHAASPDAVLSRGYALVTDDDGLIVRSTTQVERGDRLNLRFADGTIKTTVD